MTPPSPLPTPSPDEGSRLHELVRRLYPLPRSIAGPGVRATLDVLGEIAPLTRRSIPTGEPVLDWVAPPEWHFRDGFIAGPGGRRVVDAARCNLHVVNFSEGVDAVMTRAELEPHLHTLPDRPRSVPYRTNYYGPGWGFCLAHETLESLGDGPFRVVIDAERVPGALDWAELVVPGASEREILVSTHVCHPSLANDNLSGMVLAATFAAERLAALDAGAPPSPFTWRFVFVPGTIGAIAFLASLGDAVPDVAGGLVVTGLGDRADYTYKTTPDGDAWIDRVVRAVLAERHGPGAAGASGHATMPFGPYGYDERQYCSPGYDWPVGRLTRGVHGTFPEYHTSDDDLDFVTPDGLAESLGLLRAIGRAIDVDVVRRSLAPRGEPQLGRRGLYDAIGARPSPGQAQMAMLWLLNRANGRESLVDVARRSGIGIDALHETALLLERHALLEPVRHAADPA